MRHIAIELNKSPEQCLHKLREIIISGTFRAGQWSQAEDELLMNFVRDNLNWKECATHLNSLIFGNLSVRTAKQCKERWNNHLNPANKKGRWSLAEDLELMQVFLELGSRWSLISKRLENRTENAVKNRINSLLHNELKQFGVSDQKQAAHRIISRTEREMNADYNASS